MAGLQAACPWVPRNSFYAENRDTIQTIVERLDGDFPGHNVAQAFSGASDQPTPETMSWMWTHLMGRQHGSTEGIENKIPLNAANESPYRPLVAQLHYGPYGFMEEHLAK